MKVQLLEPDRCLPDGRQLRELAPGPGQLAAYGDHVPGLRDQWVTLADYVGTHALLLLLACYAAVWCRRWWLGLDWPYLGTEFLARLEDPTRWDSPAMVAHVQALAPPPQAADLDHLQELLLAGLDHLDAQTARYSLRAGIGHLLPRDYHRPLRTDESCLPPFWPWSSRRREVLYRRADRATPEGVGRASPTRYRGTHDWECG